MHINSIYLNWNQIRQEEEQDNTPRVIKDHKTTTALTPTNLDVDEHNSIIWRKPCLKCYLKASLVPRIDLHQK